MKKLIILIFVISFLACSEDYEIVEFSKTKLVSIEYKYRDRTWFENYSYSSTGELSSSEDLSLSGRRYDLEYQNNIVKEVFIYGGEENKLIFRDSIAYNPKGTIRAIYHFSINLGPTLPLARISEFEYDRRNRLAKSSRYFVNPERHLSSSKYFWSENNITKVESYRDNVLQGESFFIYDDKINYKKGLPQHIGNPINWGNHNVTEWHWTDYTGLNDRICNPCTWEYEYDLNNNPISAISNVGEELLLTYE